MSEEVEEAPYAQPEPEIVHWMEPRPLTVGAGGISATAASAFALGAAAAVVVLSLAGWLGRRR